MFRTIPLKQGLRHPGTSASAPQPYVFRTIPLKQGLRLERPKKRQPLPKFRTIPLKQGLRQVTVPSDKDRFFFV